MATDGDDRNRVKTAHTVFDIIEFLEDAGGSRLTELADELGIAKSTAHRHLSTLWERGYVVREGDAYDLSLQFLRLGEYVSNRKSGDELAKSLVDELAQETGEHAQFFFEEHGWAVYTYGNAGEHAVQSGPRLGERLHLHATAAGKAILASLPRSRVEEILTQRGMPSITENTLTDRDELMAELEEVRERGYSVNLEEDHDGLRAVGVPIMGSNGSLFGAVSVSGPTRRMSGERFEEELPSYLLGRANELELNIQFARESSESGRR